MTDPPMPAFNEKRRNLGRTLKVVAGDLSQCTAPLTTVKKDQWDTSSSASIGQLVTDAHACSDDAVHLIIH